MRIRSPSGIVQLLLGTWDEMSDWFWGLEAIGVAYMLAISAREAYTSIMPSPIAMKPQKSRAVPPSESTNVKTLRVVSVPCSRRMSGFMSLKCRVDARVALFVWYRVSYGKMTSQLQMTESCQ